MTSSYIQAPWHAASFTRWIDERLPELLAERLPLRGYRVTPEGGAYRLSIILGNHEHSVQAEYVLPRPDEYGVFVVEGTRRGVFPIASSEQLDQAEIRCVGEQIDDYVATRLGEAPAYLRWEDDLARAWLPLDTWVHDFLTTVGQVVDDTNWLATHSHARRLFVDNPQALFVPGQIGRVCPFEVPEGPNMGRIFSISVGATIRDRRLVIEDDRPAGTLGLSSSMIPFLEHNDPPRLLMGANMLRQWMTPPDPEPALVQTGNEPDAARFWAGRNLLTAFIAWNADTFEDGLVISASCARRLDYPHAVEPGDKFSNRHGTKGVISRILPDDEMPHLADGTPVDLVCSFMSIPSRMNLGQLYEAALSHVARHSDTPVIVPPWAAPDETQLREQLRQAGMADDGLMPLTLGRNGMALEQRAAVGWVYWGKLIHTAQPKLRAFTGRAQPDEDMPTTEHGPGALQGELEFFGLLEAGATELLREQFNTRAASHALSPALAERLAAGDLMPADAPSPMFLRLQRQLRAAGIRMDLADGALHFGLAQPEQGDASLRLAAGLAHPWLPEHAIDMVGVLPALPSYHALEECNTRLAQLLANGAPRTLAERARLQLQHALESYLQETLARSALWMNERVLWSARGVIAPGGRTLRYDQIGLPNEIAWELFGPMIAGAVGQASLDARDDDATRALDERMAQLWLVVNRAPTVAGHSFLAFHPQRVDGHAIRLPSLGCNLLDADFDGDQVAVFVPLSDASQRETGEKLAIAAHLRRNPALIVETRPRMDALLGLARLSLEDAGRAEIDRLAGVPIETPNGFLTARTVVDALKQVLEQSGAEAALEAAERLLQRGFQVAQRSGMGMGPLVGAGLQRPVLPDGDDEPAWERASETLAERIRAVTSYFDDDMGALVLACKSQARSNINQLMRILGAPGYVHGTAGEQTLVQHSYRDGLAPDEMFGLVALARSGIQALVVEYEQLGNGLRQRNAPRGYGVLARAMRSRQPGVVFASAAAAHERDPLTDQVSRLFVGLPPQ